MIHFISCSNLGRLEEAVRAYNSTPLEDLSDLVGLALAYCRSGLFQESVTSKEWGITLKQMVCLMIREQSEWTNVYLTAYERALAVASNEKEKAYILTALALLQHRQGNLDSAKTLLFKW